MGTDHLPDPPGVGAHRRRSRARGRAIAFGIVGLAGACVLSLAGPEPAAAVGIDPWHAVGGALGAGVNAITGGIGQGAVAAFGAIVKGLFAWPAKMINRELLAWLVAVPDYAIHPQSRPAGAGSSSLAQLGATTSAMAFAALGAVGTVSVVRYWAAGLTGSGGLEAFEGLARTVAAALLIVLWPWLFRHCADLANQAGRGLLGSGGVLDDTAGLLELAFAGGGALNVLAILIAMAGAGPFFGVLVSKIAVSAATALVFVGMPLAVMLWPIPELAWIARTAMRAFGTVLAIPLAWAVCFATFAAVGTDALSLQGAGSVVDALIQPLVAVALLWVAVSVPRTLARMAMFGALGGGGFVGRTASYLAARRADAALAQAIPAQLGGHKSDHRGGNGQGSGEPGATTSRWDPGRHRDAPGASARPPQPIGGAAAAAGPGAAGASVAPGTWTPPSEFEPADPRSAAAGAAGLRTPSWREIKDHMPVELAAAAALQASTGPSDVAAAMRALPSDAQAGVIALMEGKGGQIRGQMAHQAARTDLSSDHREAFRTLAAANPEIRSQGIRDFLDAGPIAPSAPSDGVTTDSAAATDPGMRESATSGATAAPVEQGGPMGTPPTGRPPSAPETPGGPAASSSVPPVRRDGGSTPDRSRS